MIIFNPKNFSLPSSVIVWNSIIPDQTVWAYLVGQQIIGSLMSCLSRSLRVIENVSSIGCLWLYVTDP